MAGVLVLLLTFVFMIAYNAVVAPLAFTMLSYALLWRNEREAAIGAARPPGRWRSLGAPAWKPRSRAMEPALTAGHTGLADDR
jgi:hypothetical protein